MRSLTQLTSFSHVYPRRKGITGNECVHHIWQPTICNLNHSYDLLSLVLSKKKYKVNVFYPFNHTFNRIHVNYN